jgi:uncharacterized DUF497 family protein
LTPALFLVYTENVKVDWDQNKAEQNLKKHGISFEVAITAFDDPFALITLDEKHSKSEKREWLLGQSDSGVLVVIFTVRKPGNIFRLISARKANRKERKQYEQIKNISL